MPACFSDDGSTQTVIPHPSGVVFVLDAPPFQVFGQYCDDPTTGQLGQCQVTVNVLNPATAQTLARISLENAISPSGTVERPALGNMIVAGDGNAYLPYSYFINNEYPAVTYLMLLRVSPDGSSAKVQLDLGTIDSTGGCTGLFASGIAPSVITNAATGVAVFARLTDCASTSSLQINYVSQDSLTSQVNAAVSAFAPALQREDGSYIGTYPDDNLIVLGLDGSVVWQQPIGVPVTPLYATSDGGAIVTSTTQCPRNIVTQNTCTPQLGTLYTVDQNGSVTSQTPDPGTIYSWKGAYTDPPDASIEAVASDPPKLDLTYAATRAGNLTANGTSLVHHKIGLAWCGTGFSRTGTCQQDPYNVNGVDMSFDYVANPDTSNIATAQDFSAAHPDWVGTIQANAMTALKQAFAQFPVMVETASSHIQFWHCGNLGSCVKPDQDHIAYVVGAWPNQGQTGWTPALDHSFVYYWPINQNAQIAAGYADGHGPACGHSWCDLSPTYPPQAQSDAAAFQVLMQTIGTGIGNTAAHELGHQFSTPVLPYMDCGFDAQRPGGPISCENNNNLVYNFFSGSGFPQDPTNTDSTGAQFKYTGVPSISWGPAEQCALKRNFLDSPNAKCN